MCAYVFSFLFVTVDLALIRDADCSSLPKTYLSKITFIIYPVHPLNPSENSFVNKFMSPIYILIPPIVLLRRTRTKMYLQTLAYSNRKLLWHSLHQQNKEREPEDNGILWKGRLLHVKSQRASYGV